MRKIPSLSRPCPFGGICIWKKFTAKDPFTKIVMIEFRCKNCGHVSSEGEE